MSTAEEKSEQIAQFTAALLGDPTSDSTMHAIAGVHLCAEALNWADKAPDSLVMSILAFELLSIAAAFAAYAVVADDARLQLEYEEQMRVSYQNTLRAIEAAVGTGKKFEELMKSLNEGALMKARKIMEARNGSS